MTLPAPTLKRESTRTLCDEFTTIFDHSESTTSAAAFQDKIDLSTQPSLFWDRPALSSSSGAVSHMASLESNELTSLWNLRGSEQESILSSSSLPDALPSPATSVFTPAGTPCSESDESTMLDTLSPPSSPWFPSALNLEKGPAEDQHFSSSHNSKFTQSNNNSMKKDNNNNNRGAVSDLDFFNNSFYQSLPDVSFRQRSHPYYPYQRSSSTAIAAAVRSARINRTLTENSRTAAPSDLFNVTIDEILSADPLNLADFDMLDSAPVSAASTLETPAESDDETMQIIAGETEQASGSQTSISSDDETNETTTLEQCGNKVELSDGSQDITLSMSDGEVSDYEHVIKYRPRKRTCVTKKQETLAESSSSSPSPSRRRSGLKAPRVRKSAKKAPKVYPPRKSKLAAATEGDKHHDLNTDAHGDSDSGSMSESPATTLSTIPKSSISISNGYSGKSITTDTVTITEDGSYRCNMCPLERFGRVHDLKRHQISKHNEKTWPCDFCHRPFVRRDALLRHYAVKAARSDGIHPTLQESNRLSEARARARLT
ncbi:hypothetical protein BGX27_001391 [Mortierella sp. AM989]|nr:hypothetical protein BGX27_001391 [Mortierella sp. AM989]